MSVAEDFVSYLTSQDAITRIVGDRVAQAPAGIREKLPYITLRRSGRNEPSALSSGTGNLIETQFDVECRASSLDGAEDLADAVNAALHEKRGTWGSREVCGCFVEDQDDDYDFLPAGSNRSEHTVAMLVRVFSR